MITRQFGVTAPSDLSMVEFIREAGLVAGAYGVTIEIMPDEREGDL